MEWETMSTPHLLNLESSSLTLDESPPKKATEILHLQLQQMETPAQNRNPLVSAINAKSQDIGKETITNLSTSGTFSPLTSLPNILILNDRALGIYRGSSQFSLLTWRNISSDWGGISSCPK